MWQKQVIRRKIIGAEILGRLSENWANWIIRFWSSLSISYRMMFQRLKVMTFSVGFKRTTRFFPFILCHKVFSNRDPIEWISLNMKASLTQLGKVIVSSNILMFNRRFVLNRLPTRGDLLVRGIAQAETNKFCELCEGIFETRNHLFLECSFSISIWTAVHCLLGRSQ